MIREIGRRNGTDLSFGDIMRNVVNCFLFLSLSVVPNSRSLFSFSVIKMIPFRRLEHILFYYILI